MTLSKVPSWKCIKVKFKEDKETTQNIVFKEIFWIIINKKKWIKILNELDDKTILMI